MPNKNTLKKLLFLSFIFSFICLSVFFMLPEKESETFTFRTVASVPAFVHDHANHGHGAEHSKTTALDLGKKAANPIDLLLIGPVEGARIGESFTLTAKIKVRSVGKNISIKWALPKGIKLLKGLEAESLGTLKPNKLKEIPIDVVTTTTENLQVHALVVGTFGNLQLGRSAQFNTQLQSLIEHEKRQLEKRAQKQREHKEH